MKEFAKMIERTSIVLAIIGLTFRFMHFPGAGPMLVVSLGSLAMVYFMFARYLLLDEKADKKQIIVAAILGNVLSVSLIGILFKLMFFPGSGIMLQVGLLGCIILFGVVYINKMKNIEWNAFFSKIFLRILIIGSCTIILALTTQTTFIKILHKNDPEYVRLWIQQEENPENEQYQEELKEYRNKKYGRTQEENENRN